MDNVSTRFELKEVEDPDGYNGLGSGYLYISDSYTNEPIRDKEGKMFYFDIEEGDKDAAYKEGEAFITANYHTLSVLGDKVLETDNEEDEEKI